MSARKTPSLVEATSSCEQLLTELEALPVLDPRDLPVADDETLAALAVHIKALRGALRNDGDVVEDDGEGLRVRGAMALATALTLRARRSGRFNEAWATITKAIEDQPLRPELYRMRGQIGCLRGERSRRWFDSAAQDLTRALSLDPGDLLSRFVRALCREAPALAQLEEAEALRARGKTSRAHRLVVEAERRLLQAIDDHEAALQRRPSMALALLHRGRCRSRLGLLELALDDFERVEELGRDGLEWSRGRADRRLSDAYAERGSLQSARGDHEGALADLSRSLELLEDKETAVELERRGRRAEAACRLGAHELVIEDCSALLAARADERQRLMRARALLYTGQLARARADAAALLTRQRDHLEARFLRGCCAARDGALRSALADFDRCLATAPELAECSLERGKVRLALGDAVGALSDLEMAQRTLGSTKELRELTRKARRQSPQQ